MEMTQTVCSVAPQDIDYSRAACLLSSDPVELRKRQD